MTPTGRTIECTYLASFLELEAFSFIFIFGPLFQLTSFYCPISSLLSSPPSVPFIVLCNDVSDSGSQLPNRHINAVLLARQRRGEVTEGDARPLCSVFCTVGSIPGPWLWGICMFSWFLDRFSAIVPASSHHSKTCMLGYLKTLQYP